MVRFEPGVHTLQTLHPVVSPLSRVSSTTTPAITALPLSSFHSFLSHIPPPSFNSSSFAICFLPFLYFVSLFLFIFTDFCLLLSLTTPHPSSCSPQHFLILLVPSLVFLVFLLSSFFSMSSSYSYIFIFLTLIFLFLRLFSHLVLFFLFPLIFFCLISLPVFSFFFSVSLNFLFYSYFVVIFPLILSSSTPISPNSRIHQLPLTFLPSSLAFSSPYCSNSSFPQIHPPLLHLSPPVPTSLPPTLRLSPPPFPCRPRCFRSGCQVSPETSHQGAGVSLQS